MVLNDSSAEVNLSRFQQRERLTLQRYGPVGYRAFKVVIGLTAVVLIYVATLIFATLTSFYPGTSSIGWRGPTERIVQAEVKGCDHLGPVSDMGIGFWWVCKAEVTTGRDTVQTTLDRSIATKADIGRTITLAEACKGSVCNYGKGVGGGWKIYHTVVWGVGLFVRLALVMWAFFYLSAALLGAPRYIAFGGWMLRKMAN